MHLERLNALRGREGFLARHREIRRSADRPLKNVTWTLPEESAPNDLHPIVRANYYHHAMRGSFSIKKVLPTIAPDLDFDALEEVS